MKTFDVLLGLFLGVLFLSPTESHAQWQPDVRLTNDPAVSFTSLNNARCIASSGSVVHVVWYDLRDVNYEIYYKRSTDGGLSWGADTRLTNNTSGSLFPSISVSGQVVHVVWVDGRDGNSEIYYKRSTDGGLSWGADTRLTNNVFTSEAPSVTVSGSAVHVVWHDERDGNPEIYYKRSTDGGISWGSDTRLTNSPPTLSESPSVTVSGASGAMHVVWHDERDGNWEIYYKRSTDGGVSWGADTRLTSNASASGYPSVTVSGSAVHVVWYDDRDGNNEIYYKRSTDGGISWEADTRLTNNSAFSWYPSVTVSGSAVHVVWYDNRDGNYEIYYKRSTDGGTSWGGDTRLTSDSASSVDPSVSVSGSVVHVVWWDQRDGNLEIYYKRDTTGNPTGIQNINSEIPKDFSLEQNYPNPFNPSTRIEFRIPNATYVSLKVFDVMGREVATLVNELMSPGSYEATFDGTDLASGIYFYRFHAGGVVQTKKLVLLR